MLPALKRRQRNKIASAPDFEEFTYLRNHVAQDLVERLNVRTHTAHTRHGRACNACWRCQDITREFPVAADLGAGHCSIAKHLDGHGEVKKLYCVELAEDLLMRDMSVFDPPQDEDDGW